MSIDAAKGSKEGDVQLPKINKTTCCVGGLKQMIGIAIFIIGCIGAAGGLANPKMGWIAVGLSGGVLLADLTLTSTSEGAAKKVLSSISCLQSIVMIAIAILGVKGVLSARQLGWGLILTPIAFIPLACLGSIPICSQEINKAMRNLPHANNS